MNGQLIETADSPTERRLFPHLPAWAPDTPSETSPLSALARLASSALQAPNGTSEFGSLSEADVGIWRLMNHLFAEFSAENTSSVLEPLWHGLDHDVEAAPEHVEHVLLNNAHEGLRYRRQEAWIQYGSWEQATLSTIWSFQWGLLNDFGAQLCGSAVIDAALERREASRHSRQESIAVPAEFTHAAFRLGLVLDATHPDQTLRDQGRLAFRNRERAARPIGPELAAWAWEPVARLDNVGPVHLPTLTLLAGLDANLPSGQAIAEAINAPQIAGSDPLWIYILREAAAFESGRRLGPVGAHIVARTLVSTVAAERFSYLNMRAQWTPEQPIRLAEYLYADPRDRTRSRRIASAA